VDEWAVHGLGEFDGKPLVSAMKADLDLDGETGTEEDEKKKQKEEGEVNADLESLKDKIQGILEDAVSEVRVSKRLTDSPCCLVTPEGGLHAHIERMIRAQQQGLPATKRIFEINPEHPIIRKIADAQFEIEAAGKTEDWVRLLYDQALLAEGSPIGDPAAFARRMAELMTVALESRQD
jgi:molecular chaperone HtpG